MKNIELYPFKIIHDEAGQLCNRFWAYLDIIGWAVSKNRRVFVIFWDKNLKDYNNLRNNRYVSFPFYKEKWIVKYGHEKVQSTIRKYWPRNRFFAKLFYVNPYFRLFVYGWPNRCEKEYYPRLLDKIKPLFRPNDDIVKPAERLMSHYKRENTIVVGVHIRRGDYEHFFNGHFYYSFEQYAEWMRQIVGVYSGKTVYFYLASNETIPLDIFSEFKLCDKSNIEATASFDLYSLSLCDRIIGAMSTYSRWASFYGQTPLCFLGKHIRFVSDKQFSPIVDYAHFENGKEIMSLTKFYWRCKALGIELCL